jgi:hypothetical protein
MEYHGDCLVQVGIPHVVLQPCGSATQMVRGVRVLQLCKIMQLDHRVDCSEQVNYKIWKEFPSNSKMIFGCSCLWFSLLKPLTLLTTLLFNCPMDIFHSLNPMY